MAIIDDYVDAEAAFKKANEPKVPRVRLSLPPSEYAVDDYGYYVSACPDGAIEVNPCSTRMRFTPLEAFNLMNFIRDVYGYY